MNWREYEKEVYEYFKVIYNGSTILFDQKIKGKYSKTERQIDILIETQLETEKLRIIVDCKFFSKRIHVKQVESFSSMVEDVEANQGILITNVGYSKASINRAHYGNQNIELDIVNFETIKKFQGFVAFPYLGHITVSLLAPFGWILDLNNPINNFAVLHQRGITLKEAQKRNEWIYVNFWSKKENDVSVNELIEFQNSNILEHFDAKFKYLSGVKRKDKAFNKVRISEIKSYPCLEVTGFIEFDEAIFFLVLFTPKEYLNKNLRKLLYMLEVATPMEIKFDNSIVINQLLEKAKTTKNKEEKATMFYKVASWYTEMKDEENGLLYYKKAVDTFPTHYASLKIIISTSLKSEKIEIARSYAKLFYDSAPTNPRVFQDLMDIYMRHEKPLELLGFFKRLLNEVKGNEELGAINFHIGQLYMFLNERGMIRPYFKEAKRYFELAALPKNHNAFKAINEIIK